MLQKNPWDHVDEVHCQQKNPWDHVDEVHCQNLIIYSIFYKKIIIFLFILVYLTNLPFKLF